MKNDYTTNSRYITHTIAFWKVGRIHFLISGVKGLSVLSYCEWSSEALIPCTSRGYYIFPFPPTLPLAEKRCLQCYRSMLIFYRSFPLQINWLRFTDVHLTPYRREKWKSPIVWHKMQVTLLFYDVSRVEERVLFLLQSSTIEPHEHSVSTHETNMELNDLMFLGTEKSAYKPIWVVRLQIRPSAMWDCLSKFKKWEDLSRYFQAVNVQEDTIDRASWSWSVAILPEVCCFSSLNQAHQGAILIFAPTSGNVISVARLTGSEAWIGGSFWREQSISHTSRDDNERS